MLQQRGAHVRVQCSAQVGGGSSHGAAPAMDRAALAGGAQEVPEQRECFLLNQLWLARVQFTDQLYETDKLVGTEHVNKCSVMEHTVWGGKGRGRICEKCGPESRTMRDFYAAGSACSYIIECTY